MHTMTNVHKATEACYGLKKMGIRDKELQEKQDEKSGCMLMDWIFVCTGCEPIPPILCWLLPLNPVLRPVKGYPFPLHCLLGCAQEE